MREVAATPTALAHQNDQKIVGIDATAKYKGFSLFVERFDRENDRNNGFSDFDDEGYVAQAGYFLLPQKFEIALRASELDPNSDVGDNERTENGIAFNYFWDKHNRKLQADFRELEDKARNAKDKEIRLQYQIIF